MRLADQRLAALLPVLDDVGGDQVEPLLGADDRLEPRPAGLRLAGLGLLDLLGDLVGQLVERRRSRSAQSPTFASRDS